MTPLEVFVAGAMLSAPDAPTPPVTQADWPAVSQALRQEAVRMTILDPREADRYFQSRDQLGGDLRDLRERRCRLKDAPPESDRERFPEQAAVKRAIKFNRQFRSHLCDCKIVYPDRAAEYDSVIAETDELYSTYDALRDAQCGYYFTQVRRRALCRLRKLIGPDAYGRGELPPPVPVSRFRSVR